eukprot:TRINITY_DN77933_c0_g1_i1.p1 TRINITY_DN77933_c0_g1~~TRINITY_DN77933_c0_g1_i1.p1  ORF type:complete len:625 (+),score=82.06 TRINITY_DN77933_c0_g1_i1:65-1939(+)
MVSSMVFSAACFLLCTTSMAMRPAPEIKDSDAALESSTLATYLNELVFDVGSTVRAHEQLNKGINLASHGLLRWIDRAWMGNLPDDIVAGTEHNSSTDHIVRLPFPAHEFRELARSHEVNANMAETGEGLPPISNSLHLAELAASQLRTRWPVKKHRAWYHGVEDGWLVWVMAMFGELVKTVVCAAEEQAAARPKECVQRKPPFMDLEATDMKTVLLWYGISGSDDLLWACIALLSDFHRYYPARYSLNGRRGIEQLFAEVEKRFEVVPGDGRPNISSKSGLQMVLLDWGTNKDYVATIGLSLMAQVSAGVAMHADTVPPKTRVAALRNAEAVMATLRSTGLVSHGHVYDGFKHEAGDKKLAVALSDEPANASSRTAPLEIDDSEWSYNAGAAIGAFTALFRASGKARYLKEAGHLLRNALHRFTQTVSSATGDEIKLLGESASSKLDRDQLAFKGIFLYYLVDFVRTYRCAAAGQELPAWLREMHMSLAQQAQDLTRYRLSAERGGFCGYWGELHAEQSCAEEWTDPAAAVYGPLSLMSASQLFLAVYLLGAEPKVFEGSLCHSPAPVETLQQVHSPRQKGPWRYQDLDCQFVALMIFFVVATIFLTSTLPHYMGLRNKQQRL